MCDIGFNTLLQAIINCVVKFGKRKITPSNGTKLLIKASVSPWVFPICGVVRYETKNEV